MKNISFIDQVSVLNDKIESLEQELSDQRINQESLITSEKNLSAILEHNADGIIIVDTEGIVLYVNPAAESLFDRNEKDFLGSLFGFPVSTEKEDSSIIIRSGKLLREVEYRVVKVKWKGVNALQLSVRDITRLKQAEEGLKSSEEKFKSITENSADAIFIADVSGKFFYTNKAAENLLGFSSKELKDKTIADLIPADRSDDIAKFIETVHSKGKFFTETKLQKKDGVIISADINAVVLTGGLLYASCRDITERIKNQSLIKFKAELLKNVGQSVIATDIEGNITYWNEASETIYGWSSSEAIGKNITDLTHSRQVKDQVLEMIKSLKAGKSWDGEFLVERKDGSNFYAYVSDAPIFNNEGELIGRIGISSDITERKHAEKHIEDLAKFPSQNPNPVIRIDEEGFILYANSVAGNILQNFSCSVGDILPDVFLAKVFNTSGNLSEKYFEIINNQHFYTFIVAPIVDECYINLYGIDETERKKAELELRQAEEKAIESETKYRELFSRVNDAIFIYDPDSFEIFGANNATSKLYGYPYDELIGMSCLLFTSEPEESKNVGTQIKNQQEINVKVRYHKKKDGTEIIVELNTYNILIDGKNIIYAVCHDITDIKRTEFELIEARDRALESDQLKTSFLHNVSHEIRTPLNAIVGFSGILVDPELTVEKRKYFIDIINQSSDQLLSIIDDILRIASIESGQEKMLKDEVSINRIIKLINDQFSVKNSNEHVELNYKTPLTDDESIIITDTVKLTQILTNLVGNALKFTNQGFVNLGYKIKGRVLEFYVEDSGIGIPLDMQKAIFNRFRQVETTYSRTYGGSGLGLSISKAYVEMLGGNIWLTSEVNKGSVFYFTLPYDKPESIELPEIKVPGALKIDFKNLNTLLIAEDEDSNYFFLEEIFSSYNIKLVRALDGVEAVDICKTTQIDFVLMDIKMPEMDGYEATRRIKEFKPDLKIIAQTAYSTKADRDMAFASGACDFISKPINPALLFFKINEQLHK